MSEDFARMMALPQAGDIAQDPTGATGWMIIDPLMQGWLRQRGRDWRSATLPAGRTSTADAASGDRKGNRRRDAPMTALIGPRAAHAREGR